MHSRKLIRPFVRVFTVSACVVLASALGGCGASQQGGPESSDSSPGAESAACAKQKLALSQTYCSDSQELWACSEGKPDGKCQASAASASSFCCDIPLTCDKTADELGTLAKSDCPNQAEEVTLFTDEVKKIDCTPEVQAYLNCYLACTNDSTCGELAWAECVEACPPPK